MAQTAISFLQQQQKSSLKGASSILGYEPMPQGNVVDEDYNKGGFLNGVGYTLGKLGTGAFGILEGIWDYTAGGVAKLFGADEWAEEQFANNITGQWNKELDEWYNPSDAWRTAGDVASGIGNSLVGIGAVAGAAAIAYFSGGTLTPVAAGIISSTVIGLGSAGMATTEAYQQTGELGAKEFGYGALSGVTEAGLEYVSGAAGKVGAKLFAKETAKTVAKKTVLKGIVSNFAGEAFEEAVSEFIDPYFKRWTQVDPEAKNATAQQIGYAALVGGISGALLGGVGDVYTSAKSISRGSAISKDSKHVSSVVDMARNFAEYEDKHSTGVEAYQYVKELVSQYDALDKGDGTFSITQKKLLGQMEAADVVLAHADSIQRSKQAIIDNADAFVQAINERKVIDAATGEPFHFNSTQELIGNESLLTQFAVADALGKLMLSKDSVFDYVTSKKTGGMTQADFRNFQKEATAQEKSEINKLFGVDIDSITYDDFIDTIQSTNQSVFEDRKFQMETLSSSKKAVAYSRNSNAQRTIIDGKTQFTDGTNVYDTKKGDTVAITKAGDGYYIYQDGNISRKLTLSELKQAIRELNGEQTKAKSPKTKTTKKKAKAPANVDNSSAVDNSPAVAPVVATEVSEEASSKAGANDANADSESQQAADDGEKKVATEDHNTAAGSAEEIVDTEPKKANTKKKAKAVETVETPAKTGSQEQNASVETEVVATETAEKPTETKNEAADTKKEKVATLKKPKTLDKARQNLLKRSEKVKQENMRGYFVDNEMQYISDGYFVAKFTVIDESLTKATGDLPPVLKSIFSTYGKEIDGRRVNIDVDALRAVAPNAEKNEFEYFAKIGDDYYQTRLLSQVADAMENPVFYEYSSKKDHAVYIKAKNGEALVLGIRVQAVEAAESKTVYRAGFVEETVKTKTSVVGENAQKQTKKKKTPAKEAASKPKSEETAATKKKMDDFGEKIGGARKDDWKKSGLRSSDLDAMNSREIKKYAKKQNVWKQPDPIKAVADGGNRGLLYAQHQIFLALNNEPYIKAEYDGYHRIQPTEEQLKAAAKTYAEEVAAVKSIAEGAKTAEDFRTGFIKWLGENGYIDAAASTNGDRVVWTDKYRSSPALFQNGGRIINEFANAAKKFDSLDSIAIRNGFGVESDKKLPRGYQIKESNSWYAGDKGKYYIVKGDYIVAKGFDSYEAALAAGLERFGSAADKKAKNGKQRYIPKQLNDVHRDGLDYRKGKDIVGEDFLRDFAIKGGEFGNWLSEADRRESMNYGYDAFCDLADALGMELSDISLNSTLSIGFGSRGQGLSGAVAHYEPDRKVINLTKMNGAGSLAHEWWHAFEDYISGDTHQSTMTSDFAKLPPKTRAAASELVNTINYREATVEEKNVERQKRAEQNKRHLTSFFAHNFKAFDGSISEETMKKYVGDKYWKRVRTEADIARFDELTETALKGVEGVYSKFFTGEPTIVDELSNLEKEITGRGLTKEERQWLASLVEQAANNSDIRITKKTQYHEDAIAISITYAKDSGYWDSNCEMLARAFAAYITDKTNGNNDYLSGHSEGAAPVIEKGGKIREAYIMPRGEERARINAAFDKLFAAAKEDGLIHEATREKPKTTHKYAVSESALNAQPAGHASQKLSPLQMKRAEGYALKNIAGYGELTQAERLEVEWTIASGWRFGVDDSTILSLAKIAAKSNVGIGFAKFSANTTDGKTVAPDAACYSRDGHLTIYLNPESKRTVEAATLHELTHALEGVAGYRELQAEALKYYEKHPEEKGVIDETYKALYKSEQALYAEEILPSELTAHYIETMLEKRNVLAKLTAEQPTFMQRCINWLKNKVSALRGVDSSAADNIEMLSRKFISTFNLNKNKMGVAQQLDKNGKIKYGYKARDPHTVTKSEFEHHYWATTNGVLTKTELGSLNSAIGEMKNGTHYVKTAGGLYMVPVGENGVLNKIVFTDGKYNSYSIDTVIKINLDSETSLSMERSIIYASERKGIYTETNGLVEVHHAKDFKFSDFRRELTRNSQDSNGKQNGARNSNGNSGNGVKRSYAITGVDSDGNAISAAQRDYFKDSIVRDKNGRLLTVYHGSPSVFTEFSHRFMNTNGNAHGRGFYFTDDAGYADGYKKDGGQLLKGYLDIRKPASETEITIRKSDLIKLIKATCDSQAQEFMDEESYDSIDAALLDTWVSNYVNTYDAYSMDSVYRQVAESVINSSDNDVDILAELTNSGAGVARVLSLARSAIGYDGIIYDNGNGTYQFVAFESNQFKNSDNLNPTNNADIRYALPSTKGSDKVMTELPNSRFGVRDVLTKKATTTQLVEQFKGDSKQYTEGFQIAMVNAQAGLERVLTEAGVDKATALTNYVRAGRYAAFNALDMEGAQFSLDGETRLGDSWGKIWEPIYNLDAKENGAYAKFQEYLLHWHNIDRMAAGKPVFGEEVTTEDSRTAIADIEAVYPQFRAIAEKVWAFNDNNLQLAVDSGMYSQEYADLLREKYPHYVPTVREEHRNGTSPIYGKTNIRVNNAKKAAVGGDTRILPIDDIVASQTIQRHTSARINKLLVELLNGAGHEEFKVVASEDAGIDIDTDTLVTTYEDKSKNTHQITFYNDGKRITAEVSRNVFKGVEAFSPTGDSAFNNAIMNGAAKINSTFKKLVTSLNPFFSFFRNPIRDIQEAGLYTRYPLRTFAKNYMRARQEISSNGRFWQEAKAAGITSASVYDYEKGLTYKNDGKAKKFLQKVEAASNAIEMAPRLAEFISAREAGLSVEEALLQAQDVTTNFGRSGVFGKKLNATIMPFLNPAIQGFSKMLRAYTGKDAAQSWVNLIVRSVMLGIGLTALNDLLNGDDEDYENLSDYVKENNYVIALGDGDFIKIPKGRVISVIGGAYLRNKWYMQGNESAWEGYISNIASQVTPVDNFTRTIFSPFTDISTNTTWYGGKIESEKWNDTQEKDRYDESTSSISIWLGKVFNYSPIKIDYLLDQYGGIVTDIVLPATTLQAEKGIVSANFLSNATTNSRWSTEFYSQIDKYTYKKTAGDNAAKGTVKYLNSIKSVLTDMYAQKSEIQSSKTLSDDEKLKQTKIIQAAINALQKDSLTNAKYLYEELKKYDLSDENFDMSYLDAVSVVVGEEYALKSYNKQVYEKAKRLNSLGIGYSTYYDYYFALKEIGANVDIKGNTISGSKKANVIAYTWSQNLTTEQKLILVMSAGYSISDNDIKGITSQQAKRAVAKYITKLQLSIDEKEELAEMCGLTVKNGKIVIN